MSLNTLFERSLQRYGDRIAVVEGDLRRTYREFGERARALAAWMGSAHGLRPGDRVMIAMKNSAEYAELLPAIWLAGLTAVPVNNKLHPRELAYILSHSASKLCLVSSELVDDELRALAASRGVALVDAKGREYEDAAAARVGQTASLEVSEDRVAWLFYTSGTTGRPKGAMLTDRNLVTMSLCFLSDVLAIDEDDSLLHAAPMSHGSGLYGIPYWMKGGTQVIPASGGFDEAEVLATFETHRSISMFAAPTIVHRLVAQARAGGAPRPGAFAGLRNLIVGGAPFYVEAIKAGVECFGPRIAQIFGQGESPMCITALSARQIGEAVASGDLDVLSSVGWPQSTVEMQVVDAQDRALPAGEPGEVVVRGPSVMAGYLNDPEATTRALHNGWLHTGDVGAISPRGTLQLRDRSKDVIISGGSNIYPREVEEALLVHPGVDEVSVIGRPHPEWGEEVVAFVVARTGVPLDATELDALCLQSIARFKRPKQYRFVQALPKNSTGKVIKTRLREWLAEPAGSPGAGQAG